MYINKNIDYLKWLKNKKVIIFGAGVVGQKALYKLEKQGIEVVSFCDNDENKQKEVICGIRIISAYELIQINNNDIMIIICSNFEREIKLQLVSLNVRRHIVGGANRTLISAITSLRSCGIGTCRRLSSG